MKPRHDVIISGAGPSGSLLGFLLAREGIDTLIIEKQRFPRYKICAGGLQHRVLSLLPFDTGGVIQKSLSGIIFTYRGGDPFRKHAGSPILHTVDRSEFDLFLAGKAQKKGCSIEFGQTVTGYEYEKDGIKIKTDKNTYRSKILAGADGIRGMVHRSLAAGRRVSRILGYELEKKATQSEKDKYSDAAGLDFGGIRRGYLWAFPKKETISYGIGGPFSNAGDMKRYFERYMGGNGSSPGKQGLMAQSIPVGDEDMPVCAARLVAVGDAACLGDGFTGEGIYNSLRSSHMAAACIKTALGSSHYGFEDYDRSIREEIHPDIRTSVRFSGLFYSYPMFFYKLLKKNDRFFRLCCSVMRGEKEYSHISGKLDILER